MAKPDNTQKRKEREAREQAEDGLKLVIDGAKIKCDLCTVPAGDLKVNYDTPSTQDKRTATVVEKDKKSLIFKGNCKKSPQSSSPCASVMKLADWKNPGTVYFQDQLAILLRSTIKCEYGGVDIKITDCGQRNEITNLDTTGAPVPSYIPPDFDIDFELDKKGKTIVPFGIKDFKNNEENQFIKFKLKVGGAGINQWQLDIKNEDGKIYTCYSSTQELSEVVITGKKTKADSETKKPQIVSSTAMWPAGEYTILWDGFDNKEIYDSTRFNGKKLEAKITAVKDGKMKTKEIEFGSKYSQVQWTDVKIDRNAKRIDVTLRVNLTDGGDEGLNCQTINASDIYRMPARTICDWDKVPAKVISAYGNSPIKVKTKTFDELKKYVLEGLNHYWSRNTNRGKNVMLNGVAYEVFVNTNNETDRSKSMDDIPLVYHTNGPWGRSGNPASLIVNAIPDTGMVQQISYNAGYIKRFSTDYVGLDGWIFQTEIDKEYPYGKNQYDAISDFKETAAHEIGHEILYAYSDATFSWQHKGSSYLNQETKIPEREKSSVRKIAEKIPLAPYIPVIKPIDFMPDSKGEYYPKAPAEIDLMKYYNIIYTTNPKLNALPDLSRTIASQNDVLALIWLTKIKILL
ncbi:PAAR-like protein [Flavobacterium branchiicola]|uniref:PAAR-like protein n=1 Tax=Flavobacterium branchiicola TaxID=1114875 RepID=A0ABV9P953_9FLAO|nr:PAAR-like protein [Flavobacterium branchiicola]MBS7253658.1 DUF4280 domain-containing protein [Flavobacterium branchiicola]